MAEITLTDENFKEEVDKAGLILVDFWAPWCGPCQMLGPVIQEIAQEVEGKASVGKLNVDENPKIAGEFGIMGIPTVVLIKNGEVLEQVVGVRDKNHYLSLIEKNSN